MSISAPSSPPFHQLVEDLLVGVYLVQDARIVYANPEMGRMFGYTVAELISMPSIYDVVFEPDRATVQEMLRRRVEGEVESVRYSMRGQRSDGAIVDIDVLSRRTAYQGRPAVIGTMIDTTVRRQEERALEEREARLRALLDNAPDAVFTTDLSGRFTSMNRSGEELFGFQVDAAVGHDLLATLAPEWYEHARNFLNDAQSTPRALKREVPVVTQQGAYLMVELSLQVVTREGAPTEIVGIARDVTARKRQEATLRTLTIIDELTGLYNRRGFMVLGERHLKLAVRKKQGLFLLFCDLDGLKRINDTFGHMEGDRALADAADLLRRTFRSADIIARLGGDEFTVFPLEAHGESDELLIRRLEDNVNAHNATARRPYQLSISVGVARFEPGSAWTVDRLLDEADRRLYRHKRQRQLHANPGASA